MTVTMQNGETKYYKGTMTPTSKATMVWFRYPNYNLSNFDMRLYEWNDAAPDKKGALIDVSTSSVDNVEQVVMNGSTKVVLLEVRAISINTYDSRDTWSLASSDMALSFVEVSIPAPALSQQKQKSVQWELGQNYPNPFNPDTWIPYALVAEAEVSIQIYNIHGELVRELNLGKKPAGVYKGKARAAYWDGKNAQGESAASGVYFYYLNAGDFKATDKMILAK